MSVLQDKKAKHDISPNQVWDEILLLRAVLYRIRELELRKVGLTPEQAGIIHAVKQSHNRIIPAQIAPISRRKPETISLMLRRMEKSGLVRLIKDLDKKNKIRVELTVAAEQKLEEGMEKFVQTEKVFDVLSAEELNEFSYYIRKLDARAMQIWNEIKVEQR
ncbi:MarR family winged helix-turn-helix transcriptional regulator [Dehalococcoides mccartyi]|uniref:MarR family winged helix-turn-helix transcriptional regulator n=1 Tax=Dehalococcoides mccartyi TaxID=61435 RepID=UPI0019FCA5B9|nr:DNA-binding protein [Dehalococcoides mccartyi]MBF4481738.1 DNA-binding protein [Dehalococcoides mccartyi]MBJ7531496.1 DNA-binding protein [Dehalococcoides mccartyi]